MEFLRLQALEEEFQRLNKLHEELKTRFAQSEHELENLTKERMCGEMEIKRLQALEQELKRMNSEIQESAKQKENTFRTQLGELQLALSCIQDESERQIKSDHQRQ